MEGKSPEIVSVGISGSYHYIDAAEGLTLHDYKLRRVLQVRHHNTFVNDSLYAEVWFRAMELRNRLGIAQALTNAGITPLKSATDATDAFWIESNLGALSPEAPQPNLQEASDNEFVRWLLGADEVARVRYDAAPMPDEVKGALRRFWPTFTQVHPQIAQALANSGRMPAELWLKQKPFGKEAVTAHWILLSRHWEKDAHYPLPPGLAAHPTIEAGAFPEIFATLSAAVSEKRATPTQDVYVQRTESALRRDSGLEALVWLLEMNLARGHPQGSCQPQDTTPYCLLMARAAPLSRADPRTAIAFTKRSPDEANRGAFTDLPNAYLLRLLWATRAPGDGVSRGEAEHDILMALNASPVANFCKDTGDFYAAAWQPFAAWQAWDLGRAMAGHTQGDLLDSIDTVEANLSAGERVFF
ncbi:MAG TPA: hypothetical protein VNX02_11320 [Steroidobacteraceae bacterium]|nr:hypothetical protein [Steroidobacteraceae bacterium]